LEDQRSKYRLLKNLYDSKFKLFKRYQPSSFKLDLALLKNKNSNADIGSSYGEVDELKYIKKEQESKLQRNNKFSPGGANKDFKKKSAGRLSAHCPKGTQLMASRTYAMLLNGNSGAIDPAKKTFDGKMRKPNSSGKS